MNTEIAQQGGSELVLSADQTFWTPNQRAALQQLGVDNASDADLAVFFHHAQRTGLDPFAKQIYMIERQGKWTIQTGIDGFRLIARRTVDRTGESFGQKPDMWCGKDGQWRDVWLESTPPAAAKHTVVRNGEEFTAVAIFDSYAGRKRDGNLNSMWSSQGPHMIAKCAEALALRKAFPQDLSGLYTADEMGQAENQQAIVNPSQHARPRTQRQRRQVAPASAPGPTGRDWYAEAGDCETADQLAALFNECKAAGELDDDLKSFLMTTGTALRQMEEQNTEVIDGQLVDENGVIQEQGA